MEHKRLNMRVPMELYNMIKIEADKLGIPVTAFFNVAVKEYIKQNSVIALTQMYQNELNRTSLDTTEL